MKITRQLEILVNKGLKILKKKTVKEKVCQHTFDKVISWIFRNYQLLFQIVICRILDIQSILNF